MSVSRRCHTHTHAVNKIERVATPCTWVIGNSSYLNRKSERSVVSNIIAPKLGIGLVLVGLLSVSVCRAQTLADSTADEPFDEPASRAAEPGGAPIVGPVATPVVGPVVGPLLAPIATPAAAAAILPVAPAGGSTAGGVNWGGLFKQSLGFLVLEHSYRLLTDPTVGTSHEPFFKGYLRSVSNLHGWADGDPFYVNYVGHPVQGAVTGFIWIQNDRKYRDVEIGRNRRYWKGRLRAAAFAWAYSEQFEIGPVSEASIGATQARYPQQGFVDHVITPTIGLGWIIAEDTVDRYVVLPLEKRVENPYVKMLLRSALNPSRSLANALAGNVPWHRYTRDGLFKGGSGESALLKSSTGPPHKVEDDLTARPEIAPFEFTTMFLTQETSGRAPCLGAAGSASARFTPQWAFVLEVGGCKMNGMLTDYSGDSLHYLIGTRWTPRPSSRWSPYAQVLMGGNTVTQEELFPATQAALEAALKPGEKMPQSEHALYTEDYGTTGPALKAGAGVNYKFNRALSLRVAGLDYMHTWMGRVNGVSYSPGLQVTTGLVLSMGTW
jgi:hypothetical protein